MLKPEKKSQDNSKLRFLLGKMSMENSSVSTTNKETSKTENFRRFTVNYNPDFVNKNWKNEQSLSKFSKGNIEDSHISQKNSNLPHISKNYQIGSAGSKRRKLFRSSRRGSEMKKKIEFEKKVKIFEKVKERIFGRNQFLDDLKEYSESSIDMVNKLNSLSVKVNKNLDGGKKFKLRKKMKGLKKILKRSFGVMDFVQENGEFEELIKFGIMSKQKASRRLRRSFRHHRKAQSLRNKEVNLKKILKIITFF